MTAYRVSVVCKKAGGRVDPRTVRRRGERLLDVLNLKQTKLSILLCDDAVIRELNKAYRDKDRPTDVLSFSMREGESLVGDTTLLGDIAISVETASKTASQIGCTTTEEVTALMIHGLLHLVGYDHAYPRGKKNMQEKARWLQSIVTGKSK